ncbi:MAG: mechanosensitive ion channel family protein [Deltaproteobacteria bacterium]|nr:mechanosensitive ion channel family protein [Deltaproteobacteria bacterium]
MERFFERISAYLGDLDAAVSHGIYIVGVLLGAAAGWWVWNILVRAFRRKYEGRPFLQGDDSLFPLVRRGGHYAVVILAGAALLRRFQVPVVENLFYALLILVLASLASGLFNRILPFLEKGWVGKTRTHVDDVIVDLLKKFSGVLIYATGLILVLDIMGLNIMPFVAGAGVAGIAIGFAAKDTLSNLIAGILLIIDRPFEVGDRIEVWSAPKNSATWGDVIDVGLRATKIRTTDNIVIVIPNNEIMKRDIINYTTIREEIRVRIPVGISYESDVEKAKEIIRRISLELPWVMKDPGPKVVVKSFGDSAVNLEARVWIRDPRRRIDTISHVTDRVKEAFREEGVEIPYPKREIYLRVSGEQSGDRQGSGGSRGGGEA